MSVTIKDIAKIAGLSVSTISKALNDKDDISEKQKAKVRQLASKMGYRKNMIAARLVKKRSNTIGIFTFSDGKNRVRESIVYQIVVHILKELEKNGYDAFVLPVDTTDSDRDSYLNACIERQVEGVIIIRHDANDPHVKRLEEANIPVVVIDGKRTGKNIGYVTVNNEKGISNVLEYLLTEGHKRVGFLKGAHNYSHFAGRYESYKKFMMEKGGYDEGLVFSGDPSLNGGYIAASQMIESGNVPTALLCANDFMAMGALRAVTERGMKVPEDISIVGYENLDICQYMTPALSSVELHYDLLSVKAVRLLLDMITGESGPEGYSISPEFVVRESTAISS